MCGSTRLLILLAQDDCIHMSLVIGTVFLLNAGFLSVDHCVKGLPMSLFPRAGIRMKNETTKVDIIKSQQACSGATERNEGHLRPLLYAMYKC